MGLRYSRAMSGILKIRKYGDPVLREPAQTVAGITSELKQLAEDMLKAMHSVSGVGLSAQQVGRLESICVIEIPLDYDLDEDGERLNPDVEMPLVFLNPKITHFSKEKAVHSEGCLSFPDIQGNVERSWSVTVEYFGLDGKMHEVKLNGFLARAAQHEIDHLQGHLFIDRFSYAKKLAMKSRLKRLKMDTLEQLES